MAPASYFWDDTGNTLLISLETNETLLVSESSGNASFLLTGGNFAPAAGSDIATGSGTSTLTCC